MKPARNGHDCGVCEARGEPLVRTGVSVYRHRGRLHVLFKSMPALVCRACSQRVFEADAVETMEYALSHPARLKRRTDLHIVQA